MRGYQHKNNDNSITIEPGKKPKDAVTMKQMQDSDAVVQGDINAHISDSNNPHTTTKAQVGLGNVDNTSDLNKPVSNAAQTALNAKMNKPGGTIKQYLRGDESLASFPTLKKWAGTTTGGTSIIYLTTNGLVGGAAFYASIESILVAFTGNDTNLGKTFTISADLKTLTITATVQSFSGTTILGIPVLGSLSIAAVPDGTPLVAVVNGIPA